MKSSVTYSKLSTLCKVQNGYAFDSKLFTSDSNDMPLVRIRDIKTGQTETFYKGNYSQEYVLHNGDYIIGMDGEFNITEWQGGDALLNQRVCRIIVSSNKLLPKYVLYFLPIPLRKIEDETPFVTVKHLSSKKLNDIIIPVPSIEEQQRIVDELDLLSDIIDKKKAQLRDLDALAKSIFYEMFGDPALNDKEWPVKLISDLYDVGSSKRVFESEWRDSGVPFYRAREIVRLSKGLPLEDPIYIEESLFASYKEKYGIPIAGDIMVTGVGTLGVCYLVKNEDRFYFKDGNTLWFRDKHIANSRFIKDQFSTDFVKDQIKENSHGATVGTYTIMTAKKTRVICPPIEIQNQYEVKVAEIDSWIKLIESSLKQVQALFESRMDSYFG